MMKPPGGEERIVETRSGAPTIYFSYYQGAPGSVSTNLSSSSSILFLSSYRFLGQAVDGRLMESRVHRLVPINLSPSTICLTFRETIRERE